MAVQQGFSGIDDRASGRSSSVESHRQSGASPRSRVRATDCGVSRVSPRVGSDPVRSYRRDSWYIASLHNLRGSGSGRRLITW